MFSIDFVDFCRMQKASVLTFGDACAPRINAWRWTAPGTSRGKPPFEKRERSLHSRQFRTAHVQTRRKHWRKIPPLDIFFSASSSPKFSELAKINTSAILTNRCKNDTATSNGIPWVGSSTSNSDCMKMLMKISCFIFKGNCQRVMDRFQFYR